MESRLADENKELRERINELVSTNMRLNDDIKALLKVNKRDADNLLGKQMEHET